MTQHVGRHNQKILEEIEVKVKDLREENISKERAKEQLLKIIQVYRQELETGKINLNSVGRK